MPSTHSRDGPGRAGEDLAVVFVREDGLQRLVSHGELRALVGSLRAGLQRLGVGRGDRVVALMPNCVETLAAFLAVASLGAIWSSCSPDFGTRAVRDRFAQLEPSVFLAVDGYRYGGKAFDVRDRVQALVEQMPTLTRTVLLPYLDPGAELAGTMRWSELIAEPGPLDFDAVPFDHPLWVLYSSGTTGIAEGHRPRPRRHRRRAPQDAGPASRPRAGRPLLLVHHHRLDDVEPADVGPCWWARRS